MGTWLSLEKSQFLLWDCQFCIQSTYTIAKYLFLETYIEIGYFIIIYFYTV